MKSIMALFFSILFVGCQHNYKQSNKPLDSSKVAHMSSPYKYISPNEEVDCE